MHGKCTIISFAEITLKLQIISFSLHWDVLVLLGDWLVFNQVRIRRRREALTRMFAGKRLAKSDLRKASRSWRIMGMTWSTLTSTQCWRDSLSPAIKPKLRSNRLMVTFAEEGRARYAAGHAGKMPEKRSVTLNFVTELLRRKIYRISHRIFVDLRKINFDLYRCTFS